MIEAFAPSLDQLMIVQLVCNIIVLFLWSKDSIFIKNALKWTKYQIQEKTDTFNHYFQMMWNSTEKFSHLIPYLHI